MLTNWKNANIWKAKPHLWKKIYSVVTLLSTKIPNSLSPLPTEFFKGMDSKRCSNTPKLKSLDSSQEHTYFVTWLATSPWWKCPFEKEKPNYFYKERILYAKMFSALSDCYIHFMCTVHINKKYTHSIKTTIKTLKARAIPVNGSSRTPKK